MHYGLSVEQLENEFPELVIEDKFGKKYINYVEMVPLLVQSIKELSTEVTMLKQQLGIEKTSKKAKQQTTTIEKTRSTKFDKKSETYDLSGRLSTNPQRGVYVQDGKKIAVR